MHPALKRFIENGTRELEGLEEPERTIREAELHNEMLRRFQPAMFTGEEEINGNPHERVTDKDVEEAIIQDHYDRADSKTAKDMADEGCYGDDGESESEPPLLGMMKGPSGKDWSGQTFLGAPDRRIPILKGIVDAPVAPDAVDLGGHYEEHVAEKMGGIANRHDLFTRTARRHMRFGTGRAPTTKNHRKTCELCDENFLGTQNANYCDRCKAPQFAPVRKRLREKQVTVPE